MVPPIVLPVPRQWSSRIKSAFIHTVSLASTVFTSTCALAAKRKDRTPRLQAELALAYQEIALLREEFQIKDKRFQRISPNRRPYYSPIQRMQILKLRAARRWNISQTAKAFLLSELTIISWMQRLDEEGANALIQLAEPVNKFPAFVRSIVRQLKAFFPGLGKEKIAQVLARAGVHLGVTTVGRMIKEKPSNDFSVDADFQEDTEQAKIRIVTAKYPDHVYHLDLTTIPTSAGYWVSWWPFSIPQRWPFCWWVAVVIDHFSRKVIGFAIFKKKPTSIEARAFLGRVFQNIGKVPKHLITDKDSIFHCNGFKKWCKRRNIQIRYGAVGKHGSVSVIERFIRTLKNECTRKIQVPLRLNAFRQELNFYAAWYNEYRPHTFLQGRTPHEVHEGLSPANTNPRYEPRPRWPRGSPCASPQAKVRGRAGVKFALTVAFMENRQHLPVITLRKVA